MKITVLKNLYDKYPTYVEVEKVFEKIRTSEVLKELTLKVRELDAEERAEAKKKLPVCLFAGTFLERKNSAIESYSRLVMLDFDKVDVKSLWAELSTHPNVKALWESPSGNGLKALFFVASDDFSGHVKALLKEFPQADQLKDVARATFLSFDPEILVKDCVPYDKVVKSAITDEQKYENLKKWLENKGEKFSQGHRNVLLAKLAGALNRFGVSVEFAKSAVSKDFCSGDFTQREAFNVIESIYNRYPEQHDTESFDNIITPDKTDEILSTTIEVKDTIYLGQVREDLNYVWENGVDKAPTTYFRGLDEIFRPQAGDLNVLTGIGNHGKTAFQTQLDLIKAVKEGHKCVYFSPENFPPTHWYRELIRSYIGKPLESYDFNRMSKKEYDMGMDFVENYFYYVYPPELPTPDYILERFAEVIIKHGVKRVCLDPFNQLNHLMSKRDDIYLAEVLSKFERFAQQMGVYFTVVAHPNKTAKNEDGNYTRPDVYDLTGGSVWNTRPTNLLVYHRPFYSTNKQDPTCEIASLRIKRQMVSGVPGEMVMTYDRKIGRFFENNFNPLPVY